MPPYHKNTPWPTIHRPPASARKVSKGPPTPPTKVGPNELVVSLVGGRGAPPPEVPMPRARMAGPGVISPPASVGEVPTPSLQTRGLSLDRGRPSLGKGTQKGGYRWHPARVKLRAGTPATVVVNVIGALSAQATTSAAATKAASVSGALSVQASTTTTATRATAVSGALSVQAHATGANTRGIGAIVFGTPTTQTTGDQTPTIPGSADANSILLAWVVGRTASITWTETGAGAWTEAFSAGNSFTAFWAVGSETTAPTLHPSASPSVSCAVVIRIPYANTLAPIASEGTNGSAASSDATTDVAMPTLATSNGALLCFGEQHFTGDTVPTGIAISNNSTGITWSEQAEYSTTSGSDFAIGFYAAVFTSAPTLSAEVVTFTGGTPALGQRSKCIEIRAA